MKRIISHPLATGAFAVALGTALLGGLNGCSSTDVSWRNTAKAISGSASGRTPSTPTNTYMPRFKPGFSLKLVVTLSGKREVEEQNLRIPDSGIVSLPLIGQVKIADLSLEEARNILAARYAEFYVRPEIVVDFGPGDPQSDISPWGYATVLGRVRHPGRIKIPPTLDLTISSAIQQAGGLDTSAKENAIRLTRKTADGKTLQYEINLRDLGAKGNLREDPVLQPGDVVYVPESVL